TEQFTITVTPPAEAAAGEHSVRFIAYDADRPPEEYSDQARQLQVVVPARTPPAATGTPWWIWLVAGLLVVVVGVAAFLLLRPQPEPEVPSPPPSTPTSVAPTPTAKPTKVLPTAKPTKVLPTKLPPKATAVPTKIPTAKAPSQP
ncbi:MAG: hypothetical protein REI45_10140, partial [Propionicimonas sp.]|nr:hypothetical protein [Propionicimonas sp.]